MIENTAHFIWFGNSFPWLHVPALRSAVGNGGFERAVLHHGDPLSNTPQLEALKGTDGVEIRRFEPRNVLNQVPHIGDELWRLFRDLEQPAARANMMRAAILYLEGGVYLDTDTVCVRSLAPLIESGGVFCGEEPVCIPGELRGSWNIPGHARSLGLQAVREVFRLLPNGWRSFRRVEGYYDHAVNNAVFASEEEHPFVYNLMERMVSLPEKKQRKRFALGTHLLQTAVAESRRPDLRVYPSSFFFPLGPEISHHWFRERADLHMSEMLLPDTRVVHWYASVRTKKIVPKIDPEFAEAHRQSMPICELVSEWI